MFREAIGYPTRPPQGGRSVIVGGLLLIVIAAFASLTGLGVPYGFIAAVGVLPWLLVRGYYVRIVRTTIGRTNPTPPRFDRVNRLLKDGLTAAGIAVAYLLPGAVVIVPLVAVQLLGTDAGSILPTGWAPDAVTITATSITGILAVLALMYTIGALYALPVAVARFAHSGKPGAAFELRTVISGAVTEDYAIAWGVSLLLQVTLLPIAYLLRIFVIGFFFHFVVAMGVRYCYGQGVGLALDLEPVTADRVGIDPADWVLPSAVTRIDSDGSEWHHLDRKADEPPRAANSQSDEMSSVDTSDVDPAAESEFFFPAESSSDETDEN